MTIICNVTGNERKRLAKALGDILLFEPVYAKAPTFAFVVNNYTIDRNGTIICPDDVPAETVDEIVEELTEEGFSPILSDGEAAMEADVGAETPDTAAESTGDDAPEEDADESAGTEVETQPDEDQEDGEPAAENTDTAEDDTKLKISIPRAKLSDDALERLKIMVANKEDLFKRALLADDLPIKVSDEEISFPWFTLTGIEGEAAAYTQFITALCQMAAAQKRVLDKPYDGDNDRFAMRIFMVRLGMKGGQFALARKLMMKHLTGNSGWRFENSSANNQNGAPSRAAVQHLKKAYPNDTCLKLIPMGDENEMDIQVGDHGKIVGVDDSGSVFIRLVSGTAFGIAFYTGQSDDGIREGDENGAEVNAEAETEAQGSDTIENQSDEDTADREAENEEQAVEMPEEEDADESDV